VCPSKKYFSEAHLNCVDVAFFLVYVIAFNKENKFIVWDDIISSFDTNHRDGFANLFFNKFRNIK
jgi:wobble nucleotide-excising tRNase